MRILQFTGVHLWIAKTQILLNLLPQGGNLVEVLLQELSMVQLDHAHRDTLGSEPGPALGLELA